MSDSMGLGATGRGVTMWWQRSWNMDGSRSVAMIVGVACSLVALILAWRAYRGASAEHDARKREDEDRDRR
jgi:hypothetical protein